ncbi:MAG: ATP-binding protein [Verrucomicrobiota bacterium]
MEPTGAPDATTQSLGNEWISGGTAILDPSGRILHINEALRDWLCPADPPKANGQDFWALLCAKNPAWRELIASNPAPTEGFAQWDLAKEGPGSKQWFCVELASHNGVSFAQVHSVLPALAELEEGAAEEFLQDPSTRRQMFVRLLRAEGQLNNLVRRWPGVIFSQRLDLTFQFVSPKIEELTGVPADEWKRLSQRFWQVVHEGDSDDLQQQLKLAAQSPEGVTGVYRIRNLRTGRVAYVLEHREAVRTQQGFLLGYEGVWLDVTRQTIAEKRLSSAAWKETLAVLTMGLAHDFSNIMAGIHSLSEDFQAQVGPDHPFHEGLGLIKRNSLQASQLIHRILHLHHGKIGERSYHNLNELTGEILELVRKIVPRHIRIESTPSPESLPIYADGVEFRQVLVNLALNAVDAMAHGGRLQFRVSRHETYPPLMHIQGALPRLPSVCVAIEDEGCGIPARHLASVFDPFFTTKSLEKGSGLGLYNARLFAEKHHGAISIDSVEKKGTTVRVWLPEADFTETDRGGVQPFQPRRAILVFGDAGATLDSTAKFLRENGFSVAVVSSPEDAGEFLQRPDYSIAAVLLLAQGADPSHLQAVGVVKRSRLPVKVITQITGCNQDELDPELLANCDLVLPTDLSRAEILSRLNSVLAEGA